MGLGGDGLTGLDPELIDIGGLTPSDGAFIVGNGTTWVAENGATVRTSLGLGAGDSPTFTGVTLSGLTASELVAMDSNKAFQSLSTATYPSLTELAYVKGLNQFLLTTSTPSFDGVNLTDSIQIHKAENDGNPAIYIGSSGTERLEILTFYDSGTQVLDYVYFQTKSSSATANKGLFRFHVDGADIVDFNDSGVSIASGKSLFINEGTITNYNTSNDGNPQFNQGSSAAERLEIRSVYASGTTSLDYIYFVSKTASASSNRGLYRFAVDEAEIADIDDSGLNLMSGKVLRINSTTVLSGQGAFVSDPTGGSTIDSEARTAISSINTSLKNIGILASS